MSQASTTPSPSRDDLVLTHLDTIHECIDRAAQKAGWFATDAEDFRSWAIMRFLEGDARIIRAFKGRSSIETYLGVVTTNLMRDFRNARFGKWRPSAAARAMGTVGIELDRLIHRDGASIHEAVAILKEGQPQFDETELFALASRLPSRSRRKVLSIEHLGASSRHLPRVEHSDGVEAEQLASMLDACLEHLPDEDRVLIQLRFWHGLSVADVARALGLRAKPLYPRYGRILKRLRSLALDRGLTRSDLVAAQQPMSEAL